MPPTLDLSRTTRHKMIVAPPRINLRRAPSYTYDKGPLSSTSSRFSFNHLLFASPPPSPGLPQLLPPRRRKSSNAPRPRRALRAILYIVGLAFVVYLAAALWGAGGRDSSSARDGLYIWPTELRSDDNGYEMVGRTRLPDYPTPVIVSDRHGKSKWTVSIPPNYRFPLAFNEYSSICTKCAEVASRVEELRGSEGGLGGLGSLSSLGSSLSSLGLGRSRPKTGAERLPSPDANFIDVHEAQVAGLLTGSVSISTLLSQQQINDNGGIVGEADDAHGSNKLGDRPVCGRSLTFVLASTDAGLGHTLMLLWMAYAQAQREGRGFFIDDSYWAYGRYVDIFAAPPPPTTDTMAGAAACRPPLRHEMLPCPHQARHLVVTVDTARYFFAASSSSGGVGVGAGDIGSGSGGMGSSSSSSRSDAAHLFALARQGYEALFRLNADDTKHVQRRVAQLKAKVQAPGDERDDSRGTIVGVHVRRGDRRPVEFQYRDSYMPLNLYADRAADAMAAFEQQHDSKKNKKGKTSQSNINAGQPETTAETASSLVVVASDDPLVYESDEFARAVRAQEHIRLASKVAAVQGETEAEDGERAAGAFHKFVDETFGWEGGFFAAMFWNLGRPSPNANTNANAASAEDDAPTSRPTGSSSASSMAAAEMLGRLPPSADTLRIRSLVGRAYMLDLAVLAEASDSVVCAVSATGCRLLAVMMGWDAAVQQGQWINIDGEYGWWAVNF